MTLLEPGIVSVWFLLLAFFGLAVVAPKRKPPTDGELCLELFDRWFSQPSWRSWRSWLCAVFGLPMSKAEASLFRRCTGRLKLLRRACRETWVVAGRRSGKSRIAAFLIVFFAAVKKWILAPGERAVVLLISPSRRQATVILDYAEAFLQMLPGVSIVRRTQDTIEISTGVSIQVQTASYRTPRGYTVVVCILDEIAFLRADDSSAVPDVEILRAVRPSLASVPGSLLVAISSPYSQRGALHAQYEKYFGKD
jgi:hypothetical protein